MKKKDDILMEEELEEESQVAASMDEEDEDSKAEKPRKPKTVLVPKVQNMDDYLMKHYKDYIIQELNKRLVDGELTEIVGVPVKSEHIIPGECCFRRFSYWRLNQCDFLIDIDLRVELRVETPAGVDTDFYSFYCPPEQPSKLGFWAALFGIASLSGGKKKGHPGHCTGDCATALSCPSHPSHQD